ncbi:MAG TPA: ATP-binding protein [Polyangiaceae bacterium]|jgi:PAS domain S-box-containing protein|nr:ATP-binding protein [Polyangiaceae bacterium]
MSPNRASRRFASDFVAPIVLLFGGGVGAARLAADDVVHLPIGGVYGGAPASAIVFDLRSASIGAFSAIRDSEMLAPLPLLLLSDVPVSEAILEMLRADDVVVLRPGSEAKLARRLATLIELGRLRMALSFAEQALDHSVNGLSIVDVEAPDAPLVHVSSVFERMTGYAAEEILGRNCRFLQGGERAQPALDDLRAAVRESRSTSVVVKNFKRDGAPFWNELTVFPLEVYGRPTRWVAGVQHDVTQVAEARARIESLYRTLIDRQLFDHAILDGVEVGIVTTDDEGHVTFLNRYAEKLLRVDRGVAGRPVEQLLGLSQGPEELLGGDARRTLAYPLSTIDGVELDIELSVSRGEGDRRVGFFFIFRDVRDEKLKELERSRFERLAAMGTMVAGFAHEIRNPVAAMRSIAEELNEELAAVGLSLPHNGLLLRMVERIERLVKTSLQFGRPAAPRRSMQRPEVIVSFALSEIHARLRASTEPMRVEVDPDLPELFVDERQLTQALVVLLDNALDATGSVARVWIRVRRGSAIEGEARTRKSDPPPMSQVRFEVIDDGPGISADLLDRIFDPFYTTKPTGTGLGLSIAQQIVNENGARLEVASGPGGTTFSIVVAVEPPTSNAG